MSVCVLHPNFGCLIQHCVLFHQNASGGYASGLGPWEVSPASSRMLWIVTHVHCRWDNGLLHNLPIGVTFGPWNVRCHYRPRMQLLECFLVQISRIPFFFRSGPK